MRKIKFYIAKLGFGRSMGGIQKVGGGKYRQASPVFKKTEYYSKLVTKFIESLKKSTK